jgi:8-oxo-dGTP pyrophosphatase MutT (NUDIX family)
VIQQAGSVVVRLDGAEPQYLLVRARRDPSVWIFPKGHVEAGETAEETALREAQEEAGVVGRILAPLGALEFESVGRPLHVEYFVVELLGDARWSEGRPFVWGTYEDTLVRLEFPTARALLEKAKALLESPEMQPRRHENTKTS